MDLSSKLKGIIALEEIQQAAQTLDYPTYLVGGMVRDMLLDKTAKDLDVVCVGSGIKLAQAVAEQLPGNPKVVVFKNFGTAMIQFQAMKLNSWELVKSLTVKTHVNP